MQRLYLILFITFLGIQTTLGESLRDTKEKTPTFWRLDELAKDTLPKNFRTMSKEFDNIKILEKYGITQVPSRKGLDNLYISGSGQFSVPELKIAISKIREKAKGEIYIVDLREESHGFAEGSAISWYAKRNLANYGRSKYESKKDEKYRLENLSGKQFIAYDKDNKDKPVNPQEFKANLVQTEEQVAKELGVNYIRIRCTDRKWPTPEQIDYFISYIKDLPEDTWFHFHCSAGRGRTGAFMVLCDMMRNAPSISLEDIVVRQSLMGSSYLFGVDKKSWKAPWQREKAAMLPLLYKYIVDNKAYNYKISWKDWLKSHQKNK